MFQFIRTFLSTFISIILVFNLFSQPVTSSSTSKIDIVTVEDGRIINEVPYGKPFKFIGKARSKYNKKISVVRLIIKESDSKCKNCEKSCGSKMSDYYVNFWITDTDVENFEIIVDKPLHFSRCYEFNFEFFENVLFSKEDILNLINEFVDFEIRVNERGIDDVQSRLTETIIDKLKLGIEVDDPPAKKEVDDPPAKKEVDDPPTKKEVDDPPTKKEVDNPPNGVQQDVLYIVKPNPKKYWSDFILIELKDENLPNWLLEPGKNRQGLIYSIAVK